MRSVSTGLQVSALVVLWIGTVFASVRAKHLDQWILLSSALVLILAASPYFDGINMRYRSAAIPFLAALAGLGWGELLPSTGENEHPPEVRPTEPVN